MDKSTAQQLVKNTFKAAFERKRFRDFVIELTNEFDENKAERWSHQYVKNAYKDQVSHYERIASYTDPENQVMDVLVVHLKSESTLERARSALRNFAADYLSTRGEKDAALVAFVSPNEDKWRFSYVKMDYVTAAGENGRIKVSKELTPARRYSYLVGAEEECHTAQARFLDLLKDTSTSPTLAKIEEAFSVESVTKEFFKQYADLFERTRKALQAIIDNDKVVKSDFQGKGVCAVDFAKKLLGQIVFLYFIQKKGWLGVTKGSNWGDGPKNFMRQLADRSIADGKCLFNDVLEPLFYDTLATDRGHEAWCKPFNCRIPFLNGGLFEPLSGYDWAKTNLAFSNDLFTNLQLTKDGDTGTGILDVFDRYNFTVNEAEPLEKEVAIDPEMLGKVFENLIEENRRKGLGAYYTPREIVHYMCQESLINYLDTTLNQESNEVPRTDIEAFIREGDQAAHYESARKGGTVSYARKLPKPIETHARALDDALKTITVCDPAIGSGAFPVGMMTEIVKARSALTPYFNDIAKRTPYHFKRHAIQNSIYGVDIDAGAVEIAKLRLWLSLVVDEEDVKQIKPLPNLDYKVVVGNSLMGFPFKSARIHQIEALKAKFFDESDAGTKLKLRQEIDSEIQAAFAASRKSLGYDVRFDFEVFFSEVFHKYNGFDIFIANPPYIDSEAMAKNDPEVRSKVQSTFKLTKGNWDIYIAFFELGFRYMNRNGGLTFITPDKWISKPFGNELRRVTTPKLFSILRAGREVFENAKVDAIVTVYSKESRDIQVFDFDGTKVKHKRTVSKSELEAPYAYDWLFSDNSKTLKKIESLPNRLIDLGLCENACATSDAYKLKEYIHHGTKVHDEEKHLKIINTGTIGKIFHKWGEKEMTYLGEKYLFPLIERSDFLAAFKNSYGQKSIKPKLILKGLNLLDVCIDTKGIIIPGKTTLMITSERLDTLKLLMCVLNSPIAIFYFKEKYPASSYNKGTTFTKDMINSFPIPDLEESASKELLQMIDEIIKCGICQEDDVDKINKIIYDMYRLTSDDVALVNSH